MKKTGSDRREKQGLDLHPGLSTGGPSSMMSQLGFRQGLTLVVAGGALAVLMGGSALAGSGQPVTTAALLSERPHSQDALSRVFILDRALAHEGVTLECTEPGNHREHHILRAHEDKAETLTLRGLKADTAYRCVAQLPSGLTSAPVFFHTDKLPSDLVPPKVTVPSSNLPQTAYTLFNYGKVETPAKLAWCAANYLIILDAEGNVRWYYQGPGCGDVDASYIGNEEILFVGRSTRRYVPTVVNLNKQIQFEATSALGSPYELEGGYEHDAGLSVYGDSLFTLAETTPPEGGRGFVIKEIDMTVNGVVWNWDSTIDGIGKGQLRTDSVDSSGDAFHPNAVTDRIENGKHYVYLSLWKTSQIHKIDYDTKAIVWTLGFGGDFKLLDAAGKPASDQLWFFNQHDAKFYTGNRIYLYDNGTDRTLVGGTHYSRALALDIDPVAMTAKIAFSYSEPGWAEPVWGGHDFLPESNNLLVAMGHCYEEDEDRYDICSGFDTNDHPSALLELTPAGTPAWRADFTSIQLTTYRSERIGGCELFNNTTYCPALQNTP